MTVKVRYGRDEYSLYRIKEEWCMKHIGKGVWGDPKNWDLEWNKDAKWAINTVFGNSFFFFKEERDATLFILQWGPGL